MSERSWTPSQLDAIQTKYRSNGESCNLLISAAAGSGKTAVLVERIIRKLLADDQKKAVPADRLLVVTFTNAAAREMAERINLALSEELQKAILSGDGDMRKRIKKQQLLLSVSDITTIDAFCLKLLRRYFNHLGIEPDFSIADEAQAQLLSEETMEELFAELYEAGDEEFLNLLCLYATSRSDDSLADLVRHIYGFTRSVPYPEKWLRDKAEELACNGGIAEAAWFKKGLENCRKQLELALSYARKGLEAICETSLIDEFVSANPPEKKIPIFDEWKSYYKAFYYDYLFLKEVVKADFDALFKSVNEFAFTSLARLDAKSDEEKEYLKRLRQGVKEAVSVVKAFASTPASDTEKQSREKLYPVALSLVKLVEKYDRAYMKKKLEKNLLEFHDAEQLTARLLSENPEVAAEVRGKYDEVLMDEYQDTSLLQEEIFKYVTDGSNLFMVGDMKQSIYRFRSSDPTIFKSKSDTYSALTDSADRKIVLSSNFRSRSEVLESVNDIFEAIMTEEAGELDYDSDQRLYCGNTSFKNVNAGYISECHIIEAPDSDADEDEITNPELEARLVAAQINKMKAEHFKVRDGDSYRDIENRDIVILMSSYKAAAEYYIAELQAAGIECFAESSGYFERNEIRTVLSLLKVISNPYCDIPLLALMRSPVAAFSDDELVIIRKCKKGRFFSALKELISVYKSGELSDPEAIAVAEKAAAFYEKLKKWREYSRYMSSDKLLWRLYEETDFYAFCGAMRDGEEAQANLRLLFERAKQYEAGGFEGLFSFIKYLERIEKKDTDLSSARLVGEAHNVVRIMTIHKSKGLEFPVVFITGGGKRFNKSSEDGRVILHKDYGIAMDYIDFENSYRAETPAKAVFRDILNAEQVSEEIRKLYVAVTRAKEKLFFVATVSGKTDKTGKSKLDGYLDKWNGYVTTDGITISPGKVLGASGFMDWVAPVAMHSENWKFAVTKYSDIGTAAVPVSPPRDAEEKPQPDIARILNFVYPYSDISALPTKLSVSELKSRQETVINPMPEFLKEKKADGAYYGTAIHKLVQMLIPKKDMDAEYIQGVIASLTESGQMSEQEANMLAPEKILRFYRSPIGNRITESGRVLREQPFEVQIEANKIYPELKNADGERIMLQGVIDCFFEENGELVLVDYKTDRYEDASEIHEKYDRQIELYEYALREITGLPVKEKLIYLFSTDSILEC